MSAAEGGGSEMGAREWQQEAGEEDKRQQEDAQYCPIEIQTLKIESIDPIQCLTNPCCAHATA